METVKNLFIVLILSILFYTESSHSISSCERVMGALRGHSLSLNEFLIREFVQTLSINGVEQLLGRVLTENVQGSYKQKTHHIIKNLHERHIQAITDEHPHLLRALIEEGGWKVWELDRIQWFMESIDQNSLYTMLKRINNSSWMVKIIPLIPIKHVSFGFDAVSINYAKYFTDDQFVHLDGSQMAYVIDERKHDELFLELIEKIPPSEVSYVFYSIPIKYFKYLTQKQIEYLSIDQILFILGVGKRDPSLFQIVGWIPASKISSVFRLIPDNYFGNLNEKQVGLLSTPQLLRLLDHIKDDEELFATMIKWVLVEQVPFVLSSIPETFFEHLTLEQQDSIPPIKQEEMESEGNQLLSAELAIEQTFQQQNDGVLEAYNKSNLGKQ